LPLASLGILDTAAAEDLIKYCVIVQIFTANVTQHFIHLVPEDQLGF